MSEHIAPQARAAGADDLTIAAPAAADTPHLPASIASFRVIRLIGAGGMGAVYEAEQAMPRRIVALKVIRPGLVAMSLSSRGHRVPGISSISSRAATRCSSAASRARF
jgi:serine/threonine protein kinase